MWDRRAFELCVFSQILLKLKSGDLCIPGSDQFSDYREQLVLPQEYAREIARYGGSRLASRLKATRLRRSYVPNLK